ncbi:MAG: lipopolysaccharide biosynthesis protein [Armatimonadetes bacterium]|nr:lipopolysaccharide biosynthesis protein [Armatimonadota bacterium]
MGKLNIRGLWKNASRTSISSAVSVALLFLETVLLAQFLGAEIFGLFILIRAYPEALLQLLDCRTHETTVRYLGEFVALDKREPAGALIRLIWLIDVVAGVIAMGIVLATASLASRYIVHDSTAAWLVAVYAISQFASTLDSASGSVMRVFDRFGIAALMGICRAVARFAGILVVLLLGGGVPALIYLLVGVEVAYTAANFGVALSLLRARVGFRIWGTTRALGERRSKILKFLLHTNIAGTLKMSVDRLVLIFIGAFGGAPIAAQYKVASQTGGSLMLLSDPFYQVIYPSLSRMVARRQWDGMFSGLRRLQRTATMAVIPAAVAMSGLMVFLVPLVFGEEFETAVVPAIVILWAMVLNVVFFWRRPLLLSLDEARRLVHYGAMTAALQLAVTLPLVEPLGALGPAIGIMGAQVFYWALEMRLIRTWRVHLTQTEPAR